MGYTIYWERRKFDDAAWSRFTEHCRLILEDQRDTVRLGWDGKKFRYDRPAEASNKVVRFEVASAGESCENFYLRRTSKDFHEFCKTNRHPYTTAVAACTCAAVYHLGFLARTDGWDDQLGEGIDLFLRTQATNLGARADDRLSGVVMLGLEPAKLPTAWCIPSK